MKRSGRARRCSLGVVAMSIVSLVIPAQRADAYLVWGGSCHFEFGPNAATSKNETGSSTNYWWVATTNARGAWNQVAHDGPALWNTTSTTYTIGIKLFSQPGGATGYFNENRVAPGGSVTCGTGSSWSTAAIWLNSTVGSTWGSARRQATAVHEYGHSFGLKDLGQQGCSSKNGIMQGGWWVYDNCGWNTPQQDDISGVNSVYP